MSRGSAHLQRRAFTAEYLQCGCPEKPVPTRNSKPFHKLSLMIVFVDFRLQALEAEQEQVPLVSVNPRDPEMFLRHWTHPKTQKHPTSYSHRAPGTA